LQAFFVIAFMLEIIARSQGFVKGFMKIFPFGGSSLAGKTKQVPPL